jgi:hypothetical protein
MVTQKQIACSEVRVGDAIRPAKIPGENESDRLAEVLKVTLIGANVRIETDIDGIQAFPVNRSILVWRSMGEQQATSGG